MDKQKSFTQKTQKDHGQQKETEVKDSTNNTTFKT